MRFPSRKVCSRLGLLASVIFYLVWVLAVCFDGKWTFGANTLSDLGVSDSIISVILFNWVGCFSCAMMWLIEAVSIFRTESGIGHWYGAWAVPAMMLLACIGIFNKGMGMIHVYIAYVYLGMTIISMVMTCLSRFYYKRKLYVCVTIGIFPVCGIALFTLSFQGFEAVAIALTVLWSAMVAESYGKFGSDPID